MKKGAVVENSVIFFNNEIGENCHFNKVVADVNNSYEGNVSIGPETGSSAENVTVIGWNNKVPTRTIVREGATIYPNIKPMKWPSLVEKGEVLR